MPKGEAAAGGCAGGWGCEGGAAGVAGAAPGLSGVMLKGAACARAGPAAKASIARRRGIRNARKTSPYFAIDAGSAAVLTAGAGDCDAPSF